MVNSNYLYLSWSMSGSCGAHSYTQAPAILRSSVKGRSERMPIERAKSWGVGVRVWDGSEEAKASYCISRFSDPSAESCSQGKGPRVPEAGAALSTQPPMLPLHELAGGDSCRISATVSLHRALTQGCVSGPFEASRSGEGIKEGRG